MGSLVRLIYSWKCSQGNNESTQEILEWINELNEKNEINITKIALQPEDFWLYDKEEGTIRNKTRSFFTVRGIKSVDEKGRRIEQPIIIQDEIGYLGIICKEIDGVFNFLMQAKIEPGNVNKIQISPTIQTTKSNFTQKHGGKRPAYLEYFMNASNYNIIVDQIQSEQASRFYKKRNRNIIIDIGDKDIEVLPSHKWMTLGQIKELMKTDNLVNMDTRTVISCIPYAMMDCTDEELHIIEKCFKNKALYRSIFEGAKENCLPYIYQYMNNYKMFHEKEFQLCSIYELQNWDIDEYGIRCKEEYPFQVIYCDITIAGREVEHWKQPLFEALGQAVFGLFCCEDEGILKFLVSAKAEIGCFDGIELAPTVQQEARNLNAFEDYITELFFSKYEKREGIWYDVILSEEGGRFYQEQNHNVVIQIKKEEAGELPEGYFWIDFRTLNQLVQVNNCLNIQLRNLLSFLEV